MAVLTTEELDKMETGGGLTTDQLDSMEPNPRYGSGMSSEFPDLPDFKLSKELREKTENSLYYSQQYGIPPEMAFDMESELNKQTFGKENLPDNPAALFYQSFKQSLADKPAMMLRGAEVYTPGKALGLDPLLDKASTLLQSLNDPDTKNRLQRVASGKLWPVGDEKRWWQVDRKYIPEVINAWSVNVADQIPLLLTSLAGRMAGKIIGKPIGALAGGAAAMITGGPDPSDVATAPAIVGITQEVVKHLSGAAPMIAMEAGSFMDDAGAIKIDPDIAEKYAKLYGVGSGAIEYAQQLWVLGRYSKVAKPAQETILRQVLSHLGGSAFEGVEEISQGGLENWLLQKAVAEMKERHPDFEGVAPSITEGWKRNGSIGAGVAFLTGMPGTGMSIAQGRITRMAQAKPETKKFLGEPSVQEVQNAAEVVAKPIATEKASDTPIKPPSEAVAGQTQAEATVGQEGKIALGVDRKPVVDISLRELSDRQFEDEKEKAEKAVDALEDQISDDTLTVDADRLLADPKYRQDLADAQDRLSAIENEGTFRNALTADIDDIVDEIVGLRINQHPREKVKAIALIEAVKERGAEKELQQAIDKRSGISADERSFLQSQLEDIKKLGEEIKQPPQKALAKPAPAEAKGKGEGAKQPWEMTKGEYGKFSDEVDKVFDATKVDSEIRRSLSNKKTQLALEKGKLKKHEAAVDIHPTPEVLGNHRKQQDKVSKIETEVADLQSQVDEAEKAMNAKRQELRPDVFNEKGQTKFSLGEKQHYFEVSKALREGKPVPAEVLAEYKGEKWADEALSKPAPKEAIKKEETKEPGTKPLPVEKNIESDDELPSVTSARNASIAEDRESMGLDKVASATRKGWKDSLKNAKKKNIADNALRIASEVNKNPRAMTDEETAGVVIKAARLKNEHKALSEKIKQTTDPAAIKSLSSEMEVVESEFEVLSDALKLSGTEMGRALASRKLTINQNYDLISVVTRAKAAKGKALTTQERQKLAEMTTKLDQATAEIEALQTQVDNIVAQNTVISKRGAKRQSALSFDQKIDRINKLLKEGCY